MAQLISICPSSNGSSTCGTKVSPNLSPTTPGRLSCITSCSSEGTCMVSACLQSLVQTRAAQPCPAASHQIPPSFGWESPHQMRSAPPGRPLVRWSSAMPLSSRTSARWCPDFGQAKGFGRRAQHFSENFSNGCTDTRLPDLSWRPYSLRRGGATAHFLEYGSLDKTAIRGRWSSPWTARTCINEAVSTLAKITVTTLQQSTFVKYATIILQPGVLKGWFRGRNQFKGPAAAEPGSHAVEAAMEAAAVRGRAVSAAAAPHTCFLSVSAGEHLMPRMRPGPPDHGRTVLRYQVLWLSC